ncbi:hypothetical protein ABT337_27815 [Saccharopolyspora hirsuta]|uniref:hypothetical protein n=1 Tax=Saccharopolyspora hirsuta TaxID=1837 RepID=UPI003333F2CA
MRKPAPAGLCTHDHRALIRRQQSMQVPSRIHSDHLPRLHLHPAESKIRKIELGAVPTKRAELDALLRFYEASQEDIDEIKTLAKGANQRGQWQAFLRHVKDGVLDR